MRTFSDVFLVYCIIASSYYVGLLTNADQEVPAASETLLYVLFRTGIVDSPDLNPHHVPLYVFAGFLGPPLGVLMTYGLIRSCLYCCEQASRVVANFVPMTHARSTVTATKQHDKVAREKRFRKYAEKFGCKYPGGSK